MKKFFKAMLKNPLEVGAVAPSSKFLAEKVVKLADLSGAEIVAEFGSGTGAITEKIIEKMPKESVLLCFEINGDLAERLKIKFSGEPRIRIINDGAENFAEYLKWLKRRRFDRIISSLPFACFPNETTMKILNLANEYLADDGIYIQFQYSLNNFEDLKNVFEGVAVKFEILNIPPAFVYACRKNKFPVVDF